MRKKKIWYINETAGSSIHGMVFRQFYLSKKFVELGFPTTVISSTFTHLFKKLPDNSKKYNREVIEGIDYLWLKVPEYNESKDKKRILKWFVFMYRLFRIDLDKIEKPDAIIYSCTTPFSFLPSYLIAKKLKVKIVFEVRDIWPLTPILLGGHSPNHPLMLLMSWFEKFAVKKADIIVSNLPNYGAHLKNLGIERKFSWIGNGVDLDELKKSQTIDDSISNNIPKDKFIIGFTGAVGSANAMHIFCETAEKMNDNQNIHFIIVGEGEKRKELENKYGVLSNISFINFIPKINVQSMLSFFDICYIGWNDEKMYDYGIAANKIFDYMYSGKPILHSFSGKGDLIKMANCGISVEAMNPRAIQKGLLKLYNMSPEERNILGANGKKYVLENFTYRELAKKYINILFE